MRKVSRRQEMKAKGVVATASTPSLPLSPDTLNPFSHQRRLRIECLKELVCPILSLSHTHNLCFDSLAEVPPNLNSVSKPTPKHRARLLPGRQSRNKYKEVVIIKMSASFDSVGRSVG